MAAPGSYGSTWPPPQPLDIGKADRAYRWFVVYAAAMVVLYLVVAAAGAFLLTYGFDTLSDADRDELRIQAAVLLPAGIGMAVVFAVGLFLPRRSWSWAYGLVLIILGLTSCCTWPATIPLLIQWIKPEMKARFRST